MGARFVIFFSLVFFVGVGCTRREIEKSIPYLKAQKLLGVTTTNFQTGALALFDPVSFAFHLRWAPTFSDAVPRRIEGSSDIFVLNRLGADNIQRIDRLSGETLSQHSFGRGSNPQDIKKAGEFVFVTLLNEPKLISWNLERGKKEGEIDLAQFSDSDGLPEAAQMYVWERELWVQVQRLDKRLGFSPTDKSQVVVINPEKNEIVENITMKGTNPVTPFKLGYDGKLWLGNAGSVGLNSKLDGGIEKLDPFQKKTLGFVASEQELGGDLVDFECAVRSACLAIISCPETQLIQLDPITGQKMRTLWTSSGYHLLQILREEETRLLYIADSNPQNPMIRVWSEDTLTQLEEKNWALELPPYQMEWF